MKIIKNDIFKRCVKTFFQGFLASLMLSLKNNTTLDKKVLESALLGALASGLCALMNLVLEYLGKEK